MSVKLLNGKRGKRNLDFITWKVKLFTNCILLADSSERRGVRKGEGGLGRRGLPITRSIEIKVLQDGSSICEDWFSKSITFLKYHNEKMMILCRARLGGYQRRFVFSNLHSTQLNPDNCLNFFQWIVEQLFFKYWHNPNLFGWYQLICRNKSSTSASYHYYHNIIIIITIATCWAA